MSDILSTPQTTQLEAIPVDLTPLDIPDYKNICAFTIDNVCTPEECDALIKLSETDGYEPALVNIGGGQQQLVTDVRNSSRYIRDDVKLASDLWSRISKFVPATWTKESFPVVGLNERLRFLRYDPGESFKPHQDGPYQRPDGSETTYVTIQLYLNEEGLEGGETSFLNFTGKKVKVAPKTGMVLVFEHLLFHEGSEVLKGRKYVIRTDVLYKTDKYRQVTLNKPDPAPKGHIVVHSMSIIDSISDFGSFPRVSFLPSAVVSTPVSVYTTSGLKFSQFPTSRKNSNNSVQFSDKDMAPPVLSSINQPVSEIKQNMARRFSWRVGPKIPKFIRSSSTQDTCSITEHWESINQIDYKNILDENSGINGENNPISNKIIGGAPLLISNIGKTSSSTTKTQKKNVRAGSKSLPKNIFRFLKKDKPPEIVTTPSLSPPSVSQFSYVSPPLTIPKKTRKKRDSRPKSGSFAYTKQTLANVLLRRVRNKSSPESTANDALTYTSFPDPDPEDYVNIYPWDLPDSISATEAAGGVLQMIEYDGIYIN
ncbi:17048_t:CDS:2, partial [Racocetra persica]